MSVTELLIYCKQNNINIRLVGEDLKISGNKKALTKDIVEFLKANKQDIISFLQKYSSENQQESVSITRADRNMQIPLSFAQQGMWFVHNLEDDSEQYNMANAMVLAGDLDQAAFDKAIATIIQRHEILRTNFDAETQSCGEQALSQVIHDAIPLPIIREDFSAIEESQQLEHVLKRASASDIAKFDLACDALLRVLLIKLAQDRHVFIVNMHHIVSDGWSINVLGNEFWTLYNTFAVKGLDAMSPLPELAIQYGDYAAWQRNYLKDETLDKHLNYWHKTLDGAPPVHSLPLDKPRPAVQHTASDDVYINVEKPLYQAIRQQCAEQGVTLFIFLQTAFSILLSRYQNESDIVIGTPVSGRNHKDVEPLIGLFINTLALRAEVNGTETFNTLLQETKKRTTEAFSYQETPFSVLVEKLDVDRNLSYNPLVQILLNVFEATQETNEAAGTGGLTVEPLAGRKGNGTGEAQGIEELTLYCQNDETAMQLRWEYRTSLFNRSSIEQMAQGFIRLLEAVTTDTSLTIEQIPFTNEQEHQALLKACQPTVQTLDHTPVYQRIDQFGRQAETADNIAIKHNDDQISWAEFSARSDHLAHWLLQQPQTQSENANGLIGVYAERGIDMAVAFLGVLKAGMGYVPVATDIPDSRIQQMMDVSTPDLVLAEPHLIENIHTDTPVFSLPAALNSDIDAEGELPVVDGGTTAHIIFTSGSTGTPKGVKGTHDALNNRVSWMHQAFPYQQNDVASHITSVSFIRAVWEFFTPLAAGVTLDIIDKEQVLDGERFLQLLKQRQINRIVTAPSLARTLVTLPGINHLTELTHWFISGEALRTQLAMDIRNVLPNTRLCNLYGSTEVTSDVSFFEITQPLEIADVPVGQAITNTSVLILDNAQRPVPDGMPGEICVSGQNVSAGYLGKDELTAEVFVEHALGEGYSPRIYRTGDRGRRLASGVIEYLGRLDDQIKIRGFRIEPGEIESRLLAEATVEDVRIIARKGSKLGDGTEDDYTLIAYVVPEFRGFVGEMLYKDEAQMVDYYKAQLEVQIPSYMVPGAFVFIEKFPLRANGKVDRSALPEPTELQLSGAAYVAPRNAIEQTICHIWEDLLGLESVGIHDHFFRIGGHSLLAMRLLSAIRHEVGVQIHLKSLFAHPTVAEMAELCEQGGAQDDDGTAFVALTDIALADRNNDLPLSFAQQRLWLIDKLETDSSQYNLPTVFQLNGALNIAAFNQAMAAIVERHEVLHSVIETNDAGEPVQRIRDDYPFAVSYQDLTELSDVAHNEALENAITEHGQTPFDLANDALLRAGLIKVKSDDQPKHVVLFNMHHIASDGWSTGVLINEFVTLYQAFNRDEQATVSSLLTPLPVQYADYASWQRNWLQGDVLEQQVSYWRENLADVPRTHSLPTDRPRPAVQQFAGRVLNTQLDAETTAALNKLCAEQDVTLFMLLQTAYSVLISAFSHETDIVLGTPIAGRHHQAVEQLIGFFVNTLVLRNDVSGDPSFNELLQQAKDTVLGAYSHQHVPFESLVEALNPGRSLSHTPLFQLFFVLQNNEGGEFDLPGLTVSGIDALADHEGSADKQVKFDIELYASEADNQLFMSWQFVTALFDDETIQQMADSFTTLLKGIAANSSRKLSELPLVSDSARQRLYGFNDVAETLAVTQSVHQLFEQRVMASPDSVALMTEQDSVSAQILNQQANRLAHYLIEQGVKPGDRIGLFLPRTPVLLTHMLAVLKAGAAYVALDPAFPGERLNYMVEDSAATFILTDAVHQQTLPTSANQVLVTDEATVSSFSADNPAIALSIEDAAVVIYTSGSTGRPKGVVLPHRAIVNRLNWMLDAFPYQATERCAWKTSINFVDHIAELFQPLAGGVPLVYIEEAVLLDSKRLIQCMNQQYISRITLVPSLLKQLVDELQQSHHRLDGLKLIVSSGEALPASLAAGITQVIPQVQLLNIYGSSEIGADVTFADCSNVQAMSQGDADPGMPIGQPIANTHAFILNEAGELLPPGARGELYIGGAGLSLGYLKHDDDKTFVSAEHFVHHQEHQLYRTGDLARWQQDGQLLYAGRVDNQVKLNGIRIEPGEITSRLLAQSAIRQAVVNVVRNGEHQQLVAWVVAEQAFSDSDAQENFVRSSQQQLASHLPDYMVPAVFMVLDEMPMTVSGKINMNALPSPDRDMSAAYVAPRNELERKLSALWCSLLSVEQVGIHDNFFVLGGHSLLANRLVTAIRDTFGKSLNLKALFEAPTITQLALLVEQAVAAIDLPAIVPVARDGQLPLSFAQQRLWIVDQVEGGSAQYNLPTSFALKGQLNIAAFEQAIALIIERHEVLRSTFIATEDSAMLVIQDAVELPVYHYDWSTLTLEQQALQLKDLMTADMNHSFNLSKDVPLTVRLVKFADDDHGVLFNMHHIASDGWSLGVLVNEFASNYRSLAAGNTPTIQPLAIQYSDFAHWQRQWLQGEVLDKQLGFWTHYLADIPQLHSIPLDHPRPAQQAFTGRSHSVLIDETLTTGLKQVCEQHNVTLFMLLQTAFAVLLGRFSRSDDIVMGSPVAGRQLQAVEPLIGFFVNNLVLRTQVKGHESFSDLLSTSKTNILNAFDHQYVPFEMLVDALQPERSLSHSPIFQVYFALQNNDKGEMSLPELTVDSVHQRFIQGAENETVTVSPLAEHNIKFDLELYVSEIEGENQLFMSWDYAVSLFDHETMVNLASSFETLLQGIVADSHTSVNELPLVSTSQQQTLMSRAYTNTIDFNQDIDLASRIAEFAITTPDATAIIAGDQQISWSELNTKATQRANWLAGRGLSEQSRIGLYQQRTPELIINMLAVLKLGAAYLALDPGYPGARLQHMITDAGLSAVVYDNEKPDCKPGMTLLSLQGQDWSSYSDQTLKTQPTIEPDSAAVIIYTSGSTGLPKGVVLPQRSILNRLDWLAREYPMINADVACQKTSVNFVDHIAEIFQPLTAGRPLVMIDQDTLLDTGALIETLSTHQVSRITLVPSLLRILAEHPDVTSLSSLKLVISSGEALSPVLAAQIKTALPHCQLLNLYGSSEVGADVTGYPVRTNEQTIPIGLPIQNTQAIIVDDNGQLLPPGAAGELLISGAGLSLGYLVTNDGDTQVSDSHFVQLDLSGNTTRYYRTGDLARWLNDGSLAYVGRKDGQIKLNGVRIEPGEIKSCLMTAPEVAEAVVAVRQLNESTTRLVAWVVSADRSAANDDAVLIEQCQRHLRQSLPDYMVPEYVVVLNELPMTASGKVDIKALPDPAVKDSQQVYVAPETDIEQALCDVWQQILSLKQVGINDRFFAIGGDSIQAIQMVSRVQQRGYHITVGNVFKYQTVKALADYIEQHPALNLAREATGTFTLSHWQQAMMTNTESLQHGLWQARLSLNESLSIEQLKQAMVAVYRRHDVLRLAFKSTGQGTYQAEYQPLTDAAINQLVTTDTTSNQSINPEEGLLLRCEFAAHADGAAIVIKGHQLVLDTLSWEMVLNDLIESIAQLQAGNGNIALAARQAPMSQWVELQQTTVQMMPALQADADTAQDCILNQETTTALFADANDAFQTAPAELIVAGLLQALPAGQALHLRTLSLVRRAENTDFSASSGNFSQFISAALTASDHSAEDVIKYSKEHVRQANQPDASVPVINLIVTDSRHHQQTGPVGELTVEQRPSIATWQGTNLICDLLDDGLKLTLTGENGLDINLSRVGEQITQSVTLSMERVQEKAMKEKHDDIIVTDTSLLEEDGIEI